MPFQFVPRALLFQLNFFKKIIHLYCSAPIAPKNTAAANTAKTQKDGNEPQLSQIVQKDDRLVAGLVDQLVLADPRHPTSSIWLVNSHKRVNAIGLLSHQTHSLIGSMTQEQNQIPLNAALCKHAFATSVEALARLACYATSRNLKSIGYGEYYSVAEELCRSDIINLSISIRRMSELTKCQNILKEKSIEIIEFSSGKSKTDQSVRRTDSCYCLSRLLREPLHVVKAAGGPSLPCGIRDGFGSLKMAC